MDEKNKQTKYVSFNLYSSLLSLIFSAIHLGSNPIRSTVAPRSLASLFAQQMYNIERIAIGNQMSCSTTTWNVPINLTWIKLEEKAVPLSLYDYIDDYALVDGCRWYRQYRRPTNTKTLQ